MKKLLAIFGSAFLLASSAVTLVACNGNDAPEKKVMNLSLNPSVEFVLDEENKVVSVNALNEEGNLIITAEAFVGKDAQTAASLFVEVSKESGFLVKGNATVQNDALTISISGDTEEATELYNSISQKVNEYFSAENITATINQVAAITEEQLETLVAECAPYMEAAEVKAMEYAELVETLYESRKETAEFYSQELKNAYYEAKAFAMEQAELETLKSKLPALTQTAVNIVYSTYTSAIEMIESTRLNLLVNADSIYQTALKSFREAKTAYLNYRAEVAEMEQTEITQAVTNLLNQYEQAVETTEQALLQAGKTANDSLDTIKVQVKTACDMVVKAIEEAAIKAEDFLGEISTKQKEAITTLTTSFEADYASAIAAAKADWQAMHESLQGGEEE